MNKLYNIRGILLTCVFTLVVLNGFSQITLLPKDSVENKEIVAGRSFNTDKISNTAAVSSTSGEALDKTISMNFTNTLAGQMTGLSIRQSNGLPSASANYLIRGLGTYGISRESTAKLYVDGFEVNADYLRYLSPIEIESVSILKDAASLSTFGMRGANGVIWVETKRGQIGGQKITVQLRGSLQQPINTNQALNSFDYASYYNQAVSNDNGRVWTPYYTNDQLNGYKNGSLPDVDWYDEVLKKTSNYLDANVLFNGGNKNARYNIVLGYASQAGLLNINPREATDEEKLRGATAPDDAVSNVNMDKFSLRSNFDFNFWDIFDAKIDIGGRIENNKRPNYDMGALMNDVANYPSNIYFPYVDDERINFGGTTLYPNNPVGSLHGLGWRSSRLRVLQGNFNLKESLNMVTPGLYLEQSASFYARSISGYGKTRTYARYENSEKFENGEFATTDRNSSIVALGYGSDGLENWKQYKIYAGYDRKFGPHAIKSAIGVHTSDYNGDGYFSYKYHYVNYNGRINYVYDDRYTGEFGFSYFGSDAYAPGNRYGFYPTGSAAWIISNEDFLKSNKVIDFLKLRASVGKIGWSDTDESISSFGSSNGRFLYQQYYYYTGGFNSGNTTPYQWNNGLSPMFMANKKAFAESSMKYNIGLDLNLLQKLTFTLDAFMDKRTGILTNDLTLMEYYGNNYYMSNIGKMTNKGFEASASLKDKVGDFAYNLFGMASFARNKIDFMGEVPTAYEYNAHTGRSLGVPFGLVCEGFYSLDDFNANGALKENIPVPEYGSVQPGDLKYKDLDGDGYVNDLDMKKIGKPWYPELYYSFGGGVAYKGIELNIMFRGAGNASVNLMDYRNQFVPYVDNGNAYPIAKEAWAYYPEQGIDTRATANYPRLTTQSNDNNYRNSTFWIKDNNFLRIQYVELAYNLKTKGLLSAGISNIRFFANTTNPVTWSDLLKDYNMDPESNFGYPALKSYTFGVAVTF